MNHVLDDGGSAEEQSSPIPVIDIERASAYDGHNHEERSCIRRLLNFLLSPGSEGDSLSEWWRSNRVSTILDEGLSTEEQSLKAYRACNVESSARTESWLLMAIISVLIALVAYFVDISDAVLFDYKYGHCKGTSHFGLHQALEPRLMICRALAVG